MEMVKSSRTLKIAGGVVLFGLATEVGIYAYLWLRRLVLGSETPPVQKLLFFPDRKPLCKSMYTERQGCHKPNCKYSHDENSSFGQLMKHLLSARKSLDLCVFCFTSPELAQSVIFLEQKGVRVRIITDKEQVEAANSQVGNFRQNGIALRMNNSSYLMHHKFAVIDQKMLINGSFNWTRQAVTGNNENVLLSWDPLMVKPFLLEFEKLWNKFDPAHAS